MHLIGNLKAAVPNLASLRTYNDFSKDNLLIYGLKSTFGYSLGLKDLKVNYIKLKKHNEVALIIYQIPNEIEAKKAGKGRKFVFARLGAPTWPGRLSLFRIDFQLLTINIIRPVGRFTRSPPSLTQKYQKTGMSTGK